MPALPARHQLRGRGERVRRVRGRLLPARPEHRAQPGQLQAVLRARRRSVRVERHAAHRHAAEQLLAPLRPHLRRVRVRGLRQRERLRRRRLNRRVRRGPGRAQVQGVPASRRLLRRRRRLLQRMPGGGRRVGPCDRHRPRDCGGAHHRARGLPVPGAHPRRSPSGGRRHSAPRPLARGRGAAGQAQGPLRPSSHCPRATHTLQRRAVPLRRSSSPSTR